MKVESAICQVSDSFVNGTNDREAYPKRWVAALVQMNCEKKVAAKLDKMGIATRSGQMCAEPLMDRYGVTGMLRISLAPYNTMDEAVYFVECLDKAINMLI